MENPFKNTGEEEKVLTPVERIREAREKAAIPENLEKFFGDIGKVAKLEILTRYVEQYPQGGSAEKVANFFEHLEGDLPGMANDYNALSMDMRRKSTESIKNLLADIEKEIGDEEMKKLIEGKSAEQKM